MCNCAYIPKRLDRYQFCCSRTCGGKYGAGFANAPRLAAVPRATRHKTCETCGSQFYQQDLTKLRRQRFCSKKCSRAWQTKTGVHTGREWKTTPQATESPSVVDLAWAAGIYEGEGSCHSDKRTSTVAVAQKDTWLLFRLKAMFGGQISRHKGSRVSYWTAHGARARGFLYTIYTWLSPRRRRQVEAYFGVTA